MAGNLLEIGEQRRQNLSPYLTIRLNFGSIKSSKNNMTLKKYLFSMSFLSLLFWLVFVFVAKLINPETSNWIGFSLFYLSLFLAASSVLALLGFVFRLIFLRKIPPFTLAKTSFRQSFLFSFLLIAILLMLAESLFSWLNIIIVILILSILEYIFISEK